MILLARFLVFWNAPKLALHTIFFQLDLGFQLFPVVQLVMFLLLNVLHYIKDKESSRRPRDASWNFHYLYQPHQVHPHL